MVGPAPAARAADLGPALDAVRRLVDAGAKPRAGGRRSSPSSPARSANALYRALTAD